MGDWGLRRGASLWRRIRHGALAATPIAATRSQNPMYRVVQKGSFHSAVRNVHSALCISPKKAVVSAPATGLLRATQGASTSYPIPACFQAPGRRLATALSYARVLDTPTAPHLFYTRGWSLPAPPYLFQHRHNSSFIKQVMNQVKREMEANEELRKSVKEFRDSKVVETSSQFRNQLRQAVEASRVAAQKAAVHLSDGAKTVQACLIALKSTTDATVARLEASSSAARGALQASHALLRTARVGSGYALNVIHHISQYFRDEKPEAARIRVQKWRNEMERKRKQRQGTRNPETSSPAPSDASRLENSERNGKTDEPEDDHRTSSVEEPEVYALVVSEGSAWDRFGTKLRDMPFLHHFFESEALGRLFCESSQAAALRDMKTLDPTFKLPELVELAEHVIAPHIVQAFLKGDREALRRQCREASFAAMDQSIKEREQLKLSLDPTILFLRNLEFKGATKMPDSPPWFVFTFSVQQINCLRDKKGKVVLGAIDDIREVMYTIAINKHPEPETEGLEYPWQVAEFAMLANNPCW